MKKRESKELLPAHLVPRLLHK